MLCMNYLLAYYTITFFPAQLEGMTLSIITLDKQERSAYTPARRSGFLNIRHCRRSIALGRCFENSEVLPGAPTVGHFCWAGFFREEGLVLARALRSH